MFTPLEEKKVRGGGVGGGGGHGSLNPVSRGREGGTNSFKPTFSHFLPLLPCS